MEAKIEKISELSKLLSVKTRMSDDYFIFLSLISGRKNGKDEIHRIGQEEKCSRTHCRL